MHVPGPVHALEQDVLDTPRARAGELVEIIDLTVESRRLSTAAPGGPQRALA